MEVNLVANELWNCDSRCDFSANDDSDGDDDDDDGIDGIDGIDDDDDTDWKEADMYVGSIQFCGSLAPSEQLTHR